jgi:hypothetical protein
MNFNITSPLDSAHNFTARFKEEFVIPKNSSAYLNHIKISRDRRITLLDDNTIDLVFEDPIPAFKADGQNPNTPCLADENNNHRVTIPKGVYSGASLTTEINKRIQTLFNREDALQNTRGFYNAGTLNVQDYRTDDDEVVQNREEDSVILSSVLNDIDTTLANAPTDSNNNIYENRFTNSEFVANAGNKVNDVVGDGTPASPAYTTNSATNAYDNYALSDDPILHYSISASDYRAEGFASQGQSQTIFPATDNGDLEQQYKAMPRIHAVTRQTLDALNGLGANAKHFVGLYSVPYASAQPQAAAITTMGFSPFATRTQGTTLLLDGTLGCPVCFFGVELGGASVKTAGSFKTLTIYGGAQDDGGVLKDMQITNATTFPHGGAKVDRMLQIAKIDLDDLAIDNLPFCDDDDKVEVIIAPYYRTQNYSDRTESGVAPVPVGFTDHRVYRGFVNRRILHFQVILKNQNGRYVEVYNTLDSGAGSITGTFLEGGNTEFTNTQSNDMTQMNLPFHVLTSIFSNNAAGAGWEKLNATYIDRTNGNGNVNRTFNIIHGLRYRISKELATYIDSSIGQERDPNTPSKTIPNQLTTTANYPTLPARLFGYFPMLPHWVSEDLLSPVYACAQVFKDMYADAIDDSYTIYINNLPLRNYKNSRTENRPTDTKGGYNKNILANVPLPYQTEYIVGTNLIGYYEPFIKPITELRNQNFKANSFDVEIRNAKDDTPAKYLRSVTINFTIVDKKSKLIN